MSRVGSTTLEVCYKIHLHIDMYRHVIQVPVNTGRVNLLQKYAE